MVLSVSSKPASGAFQIGAEANEAAMGSLCVLAEQVVTVRGLAQPTESTSPAVAEPSVHPPPCLTERVYRNGDIISSERSCTHT